jgi:hypothetical protein
MHETPEEIKELQALLDRSYASAGEHLLSIHEPKYRMTAEQVAQELQGMVLLNLATVTARCEPRVGGVDGFFYRGRFWFGTSATSARMRHIRARPQVSATHIPRETLGITVHGRAVPIDPHDPEHHGLRDLLRSNYPGWDDFAGDAPYCRIDADRMFTFYMEDTSG